VWVHALAKEQITLERIFTHVGECPQCHGISFNFKEKVLMFEMLSQKERRKIRKMVRDGAQLERLQEEYDDLRVEEFVSWECEQCGFSGDFPTKGGP